MSDSIENFVVVHDLTSIRQTFAWVDVYRTTDAPNRQIRRLMEKDNKKAREKARKEYNERVRVRCRLFLCF